MTYPPGGPGYPSAQQPQLSSRRPPSSSASCPTLPRPRKAQASCRCISDRRGRVARPRGVPVELRPGVRSGCRLLRPRRCSTSAWSHRSSAGLIAGVGLLPKQKTAAGMVAVLSVLAFLLVIAIVLTAPAGVDIDWGLYPIVAFRVVQAIAAVAGAAAWTRASSPRRRRGPGTSRRSTASTAHPGTYYGQPHQPAHRTAAAPQQQQRPGYPAAPYGGRRTQGGPPASGCISRPAGLAPHATQRLPHLRPAAVDRRTDRSRLPAHALGGILAVRLGAVVV